MTYAIIETGGKQLRVEPGRFYDVERLPHEVNATVSLDQVLLVQDGDKLSIGQPLVEDATVNATVMRHFRDRKIIVFKMRPKKKTRKKQGHRQELTRLMIDSIHLKGSAIGADQEEVASDSQSTTAASGSEPASKAKSSEAKSAKASQEVSDQS